RKLGLRLLSHRHNLDLERRILSKLRGRVFFEASYAMQAMVDDIETQSLCRFKDFQGGNTHADIDAEVDLTVTVGNSGNWPSYASPNLLMPVEMMKCMAEFEKLYRAHTNMALDWELSLGKCIVVVNDSVELELTTKQACLLALFNSSDALSFSDICSKLNLPADDVVPLLKSFSCGNYKILIKLPATDEVCLTDNFIFNTKFTSDRSGSIKIPLPLVNAKKKMINEDVIDDYIIRAAIMRIMKWHKVLPCDQLVSECAVELRAMLLCK
ncbi:hypothetical protein MKW94_028061, partial [Papaver nudicaule]|nr:hypothetical protein [Papaver nudicaule]